MDLRLEDLTPTIAADRLAQFADEGRLVQRSWHEAREGRELACAIGSFHPDINDPAECPARVMPEWCARLIVPMFDGLATDDVVPVAKRFAGALRLSEGFTSAQWGSVRLKFLHFTVSHALESACRVADKLDERGKAAWAQVQTACGDVLLLLSQGKSPGQKERAAADAAANAAADAADAAANAAADAAYAAANAANAAASAAADAAYAAANAAADAAYAAANAAADAAYAAADAAANAAADAAYAAANAAYAAANAAYAAANAAYAAANAANAAASAAADAAYAAAHRDLFNALSTAITEASHA